MGRSSDMDDATGQETYTAEQRETLESGLRILARMIARRHLRCQGTLFPEDFGSTPGDESSASSPDSHHGDGAAGRRTPPR